MWHSNWQVALINTSKSMKNLLIAILLIFLASCVGYKPKVLGVRTPHFQGQKLQYPERNWGAMPVYTHQVEIEKPFEAVAELTVTGAEGSSLKHLYRELQKEAGRYKADAIFIRSERYIDRDYFDGVSAVFDVLASFGDDCCCDETEVYAGTYETREIRALAIKFR